MKCALDCVVVLCVELFYIHYLQVHKVLFVVDENSISWVGSDRDYTYEELLNRAFEIMRDKNPDMAAGKKQKFVMRPPQVILGTTYSAQL